MNPLTDFYQQAIFVWEKGGGLMFALLGTFSLSLFPGFRTLAKNEDSYSPKSCNPFPREKWAGFQEADEWIRS